MRPEWAAETLNRERTGDRNELQYSLKGLQKATGDKTHKMQGKKRHNETGEHGEK